MMFNSKTKEENPVSIWEHINFALDITTLISFCILVLKIFSQQSVPNFKLAAIIMVGGAAIIGVFAYRWVKIPLALATLVTFIGYNFGFNQDQSAWIAIELLSLIACQAIARGILSGGSGNNLFKVFNPFIVAGIATQTLTIITYQMEGQIEFQWAIILIILIPFVNSLSSILSVAFTFFSLYFFIWKQSGGNLDQMKVNFIYFGCLLLALIGYFVIFLMFRKK